MDIVEYVHRFLTSGTFSILLETTVVFALLRLVFKSQAISTRKIIFTGFLATFATIPYVWFVFPIFFGNNAVWVSEPFAFLLEATLYRYVLGTSWRVSVTLSFAANVASFFGGPLLRMYGLWVYW